MEKTHERGAAPHPHRGAFSEASRSSAPAPAGPPPGWGAICRGPPVSIRSAARGGRPGALNGCSLSGGRARPATGTGFGRICIAGADACPFLLKEVLIWDKLPGIRSWRGQE